MHCMEYLSQHSSNRALKSRETAFNSGRLDFLDPKRQLQEWVWVLASQVPGPEPKR